MERLPEVLLAELRLVPFLDALDAGAVVFSRDGVLRYVNPAAEQLVGRRASDIVGVTAPDLPGVIAEPWRRDPGTVRVTSGVHGARVVENRVQVLGADHCVVLLRDVTLEPQLAPAGGVASALDLIAAIGHDVRNPVHAITLTVETLLSDHSNEPLALLLVRMRNNAERVGRLLEQLLDVARFRLGGGLELVLEQVSLGDLVSHHIDEVRHGAVQPFELEVRGDTAGRWDRDRIAQVLTNLLGNAVRHGTQDAPIQVEVDGSAADEVLISVWNGGSIPESRLPTLFEPSRGITERRDGSVGVGLYIAQQIMRAHGGVITVRSSPLAGTTFVVSLPRSA